MPSRARHPHVGHGFRWITSWITGASADHIQPLAWCASCLLSADQNVFRLIIQISTHQSPCYLPRFLFPCVPTSCSPSVLPDNAHRLSSQLLNLCVHGTSRREQHCSNMPAQ